MNGCLSQGNGEVRGNGQGASRKRWLKLVREWGVHIVTASQDSDEIYGYEDFAIGWVDDKTSSLHGARKVLTDYWKNLRDEFGQERWEELLDVSYGEPEEWTNEVWSN